VEKKEKGTFYTLYIFPLFFFPFLLEDTAERWMRCQTGNYVRHAGGKVMWNVCYAREKEEKWVVF
jgi:hypothetical protein